MMKRVIPEFERVLNLMNMAVNAALHLESVIEDALDLSRIENNKFSLNKENFNIKDAIFEVCEIMRF